MEEDIKILEDLAKILDRTCENNNCEQSRAIEHLIKAYKELEEFKKQVTEIENTNFIKYKNYIPVSLVEEKIEEYRNKAKEFIKMKEYNQADIKMFYIYALQKLLEKRK